MDPATGDPVSNLGNFLPAQDPVWNLGIALGGKKSSPMSQVWFCSVPHSLFPPSRLGPPYFCPHAGWPRAHFSGFLLPLRALPSPHSPLFTLFFLFKLLEFLFEQTSLPPVSFLAAQGTGPISGPPRGPSQAPACTELALRLASVVSAATATVW